jgi:putative protein kinase ArgK-like GTPase of G3E family
MAAWITFVPDLRAQQSAQEAKSILTSGKWHFADNKVIRNFKPNGTYTSSNTARGTWTVTQDAVEIMFGPHKYRFPLPIGPDTIQGVDPSGKPVTLVRVGSKGAKDAPDDAPDAADDAAASPTPPVSAEVQQSASAIIQAYNNSLVFVTGSAGSGSGFVATISGANFLVTNVHVAAGIRDAAFKTLDGTVVQGGAPSMAVGEDIFCMALPTGGKPFEIMKNVDTNAAVGDDVVVLGNAEGAGVVNTLLGKIVGIGPNLVEIDAPFVPGNSGSPIIHLKTGKVIGVATYLVTNQYDLSTNKKLKKPVVRRFGYRLDSVKGWQPVDWRAFDAQAAQMEGIDTLTDDLYDFFRDLDEHKGVVTLGRHTNPVIKTRIDDWIASKHRNSSGADIAEADANFASFLKVACESDVTAAQRQITYDYFQRDLADQKQTRDQMAKAFQEIIRAIGQ